MPHDCSIETQAVVDAHDEVDQKQCDLDVAEAALDAAELELEECLES